MPKPMQSSVVGDKSLEMTMRDVLNGLTDTAAQLAFAADASHVEILSLEMPRDIPHQPVMRPDNVVAVDTTRSHNIVDYLIRRETMAIQRVAAG